MANLFLESGECKTFDITQNSPTSVKLTDKVKWVKDLLDELNSDVLEEDRSLITDQGSFQIEFDIKRGRTSDYMEYVLATGELNAQYNFSCVRCLKMDQKTINRKFNAAFIDEIKADSPEYEDQTSIYLENEERELFFFQNKVLNFRDFIHEQLFYEHDSYPLHAADCKGLCPVCGVDKNIKDCGHTQNQNFSGQLKQ